MKNFVKYMSIDKYYIMSLIKSMNFFIPIKKGGLKSPPFIGGIPSVIIS